MSFKKTNNPARVAIVTDPALMDYYDLLRIERTGGSKTNHEMKN